MNIFEKVFLQQVTFIYDCNIMQKKVGVTRGQVTSSGLPHPPDGNRVGCDCEKTIVKTCFSPF